jgi:thiol-disulfide isomerase/thioredoxin
MQTRTLSHLSWIALLLGWLLAAPGVVGANAIGNFWMTSLAGTRFDSREHKGPIVVSFFFVGCVPCIKEIPELHAMITAEHPEAALLFVDPLGEDSGPKIEAFAKELGVPVDFFYRDPLGRFAKRFFRGEFVFPTIIGFHDGKELFRMNGLNGDAPQRIRAALRQ